FVVLHRDRAQLEQWQSTIREFLEPCLLLNIHPKKQTIREFKQGLCFLGFRLFPYHRLLRQSNLHTWQRKVRAMVRACQRGTLLYDDLYTRLDGWIAYVRNANTFNLRRRTLDIIEIAFPGTISSLEIERWEKSLRSISYQYLQK
ncbi:MAG TPA: hypothetical protein VJK52_02060, partial [Candidatus Nanoarchaeia archaeon]|nr:hypothetical protein [Candidatus Nanoarchaeia archaeon]